MMWLSRTFLATFLLLAACSPDKEATPKPMEPDANSIAQFCNMSLVEHAGPKGQIFLKGSDRPLWFASVGDTFVYLETELTQPAELLAVYVNDMGKGDWEHPAPGAWIEAHGAIYVVGSSKNAEMGGKEAIPFSDKSAAEVFVKQFGGELADFETAAKMLSVEHDMNMN